MKIFFARHGEYQNPANVMPCRLPGFSLSEKGIAQIQKTAEVLSTQKIRAIYTSPVQRCLESAGIISKSLKLFPNIKDSLIEVGTPLEGLKIPDFPIDIYEDPRHIQGGGETKLQVFERVANFIASLKLLSKKSNFLIVSHGDPIMIYLRKTLGKELRYIPMGGLVSLDFGKSGLPTYSEII